MAGAHLEPGLGPACPAGRWSRWLQGVAPVPTFVWGPGNTVPGRQAGRQQPQSPACCPRCSQRHQTRPCRHSLTTLCTDLPQGWRKAQPLRARDPQAQTRHTSGLLLPAASPVLGCDHDRSAGCQGPALLLLPRGDTSPQVPFIPPTHRGMGVGGGGSLACPRPPVVTLGDFLLKDQRRRG